MVPIFSGVATFTGLMLTADDEKSHVILLQMLPTDIY
jgi:hypothetical protein